MVSSEKNEGFFSLSPAASAACSLVFSSGLFHGVGHRKRVFLARGHFSPSSPLLLLLLSQIERDTDVPEIAKATCHRRRARVARPGWWLQAFVELHGFGHELSGTGRYADQARPPSQPPQRNRHSCRQSDMAVPDRSCLGKWDSYIPDTIHGTVIGLPISWGGGFGGQLIGIYSSPIECLGIYDPWL